MTLKTIFFGTAMLALSANATWAGDISVSDSYARSASKAAKSGAAFLVIENDSDRDDRLIDVQSPAAELVQLHTHKENSDGVMQMVHVEDGFALPAGGQIMMKRGAEHVMLMGLTGPMIDGQSIPLTLTFEQAGEITVEVPVDLERKPE